MPPALLLLLWGRASHPGPLRLTALLVWGDKSPQRSHVYAPAPWAQCPCLQLPSRKRPGPHHWVLGLPPPAF